MERIRIPRLESREYEHPLDRKTLYALNKIPLAARIQKLISVPGNIVTSFDHMANYVRVTETQFPTLHRMMCEACEVLDVAVPKFYISSEPILNAVTTCPNDPLVLIYSYLLDHFDNDEIMFIIGHELSHIKANHIILQQIGGMISSGVFGTVIAMLPNLPGIDLAMQGMLYAYEYALFEWSRASEYTCDRGGYLACQDIDASCRALMKLSGLSNRFANELNLDEFKRQGREFQEINLAENFGGNKFLGKTASMIAKIMISHELTHPWPIARVHHLMKFDESGEFQDILQRKTARKNNGTNDDLATALEELASACECGAELSEGAKFCIVCGRPVVSKTAILCECGAELSEDAKFCIICGRPVVTDVPTLCECGAELSESARFCMSCGRSVEQHATLPLEQQPPETFGDIE